ncbi:MAG: DUF58 domain-containing protein [Polyangiales bacterium]|nr:DUF58 domain-containing protein [Myxococcales bacterium]
MSKPRYKTGRHRVAKLTREGKAFVFVSVGVAFAALNTGNNLVYLMLGLLLSLILLSMVMSELVMQRLEVARRAPRRAFSGEPARVEYSIRNARPWTVSYALEVDDWIEGVPPGRGSFFVKIAPGEIADAAHVRVAPRRGVVALRGYRVRTRYPFGIVEKYKIYDQPSEWLIYPAREPVRHAWPSFERRGEERHLERPGHGAEPGGLREYRAGDEARSIHWRRSAALGDLVVRERELEASSIVQIYVNNALPDGAEAGWYRTFETAIARAAYLVGEASNRGAAVEVVARNGRSLLVERGVPPDAAWRFLALLEPVPARELADPVFRRGAHVIDAGDAEAVAA